MINQLCLFLFTSQDLSELQHPPDQSNVEGNSFALARAMEIYQIVTAIAVASVGVMLLTTCVVITIVSRSMLVSFESFLDQ